MVTLRLKVQWGSLETSGTPTPIFCHIVSSHSSENENHNQSYCSPCLYLSYFLTTPHSFSFLFLFFFKFLASFLVSSSHNIEIDTYSSFCVLHVCFVFSSLIFSSFLFDSFLCLLCSPAVSKYSFFNSIISRVNHQPIKTKNKVP